MKLKSKVTVLIISFIMIISSSLTVLAYDDMTQNLLRITDYYNQGYYYEMRDEITWARCLNLSEEDINILNTWSEIADYVIININKVDNNLNKAQRYCDNGMYFEAKNTLDDLANTISMTPSQLEIWSAKRADAIAGINRWNEYINNGYNYPSNIRYVMQQLNVPFGKNITYTVSSSYYWDGAGIYLVYVDFYQNGKLCACAEVDVNTYEIMSGILKYRGI